MAYEQRDNSGSLFRNDKQGHDSWPDYKGTVRVAGIDYWLSGWLKTSQSGKKYMSLATKPKDAPKPAPQPASDGFNDQPDIPF